MASLRAGALDPRRAGQRAGDSHRAGSLRQRRGGVRRR
ncbi:putative membrane protein [Pseudomonas aeruginosa 39016]|nr:putative membrane protein [Pseudomonas aeruginosa 39016]